ncbi:MAG TPA: hypothetical protein VFM10_09230 [Terriglobales bacterium]|nr:hypothetical protein [Terriglobales bacterium]
MACMLPWPALIWLVLLAPKGLRVARTIAAKSRQRKSGNLRTKVGWQVLKF